MINLCIPTLNSYESLFELLSSAENGSLKPDRYIVIDNDATKNKYHKIEKSFENLMNKRDSNFFEKIEIINPEYNLGVSGSWNYFMNNFNGMNIISNDDIVLSEKSIEYFVSKINENSGKKNKNIFFPKDLGEKNIFSFFYLHKELFDSVGEFDENFYPAYYEDCDYKIRLQSKQFGFIAIDNCDIDHKQSLTLLGKTEEEKLEHHDNFIINKEYYISKWGGDKSFEKFSVPFNNENKKIVVGFPTLNRYDLLHNAILTFENGNIVPDQYVVVDNGFNHKPNRIKGFKKYLSTIENKLPMSKIKIIKTPYNWGVSKSWNFLMKNYIHQNLIISNDDIECYENTVEEIINASKSNVLENVLAYTCNCHKNNAFSFFMPTKEMIKVLGYFDENFYPAYYEDCDYNRVLSLNPKYTMLSVDNCTFNHLQSSTKKRFSQNEELEHHKTFTLNKMYYISKWGGDLGQEKYTIPFNKDGWKVIKKHKDGPRCQYKND